MKIVAWVLIVMGLAFVFDGGKKDRRTKTGYKDNNVPSGCMAKLIGLCAALAGFGILKLLN